MRAPGGLADPYFTHSMGGVVGAGGYPLLARRGVLDGKTEVDGTLVHSERTVVLIGAVSQSNQGTHLQGTYVPTGKVHNFLIDNGGCYQAADPLVGCTWSSPSYEGNYLSRVGDNLISAGKADRVIVVPMAVAGTRVSDWAKGGVCNHLLYAALSRLRAKGYFAAHRVFMLSHIGEADNAAGTDAADYVAAAAKTFCAVQRYPGFPGRIFSALCSWSGGITSAPVRRGQALAMDGDGVVLLGDSDGLGSSYRYDNTHFNAAGASAWAGVCASAIAPYL